MQTATQRRPHFNLKPSREPALQRVHQSADVETTHEGSESSELRDRIVDNLRCSGYYQLRHLDVDVADGAIRLSGQLNRYYLLQVAHKTVLSTPGVNELISRVEVVRPERSTERE